MALSYNRTYVENQSTGKALEGVVVRVYFNGVLQSVFADESSTPLPTVLTGADGSATYFVDGDGVYEEEYIYNGDILDRVKVPIFNPANYAPGADVDAIIGAPAVDGDLGTFTGSTIADNSSAKTALQALETATELRPTSATLAASGGAALVGFLQSGTGAVARTTQTKMRESVSVLDFGAVGDGTTDDTAAIQAAVTAHRAVNFGNHDLTFKVTAAITLRDGQKLDGRGATIQQFTDQTIIFNADNRDRVLVEGFRFVGKNEATYFNNSNSLAIAIRANGATRIKVTKNEFEGFHLSAFTILNGSASRIEFSSNVVKGPGAAVLGVDINNRNCFGCVLVGSNIRIFGNEIYDTAQGIFVGLNSENVAVVGNVVHDTVNEHGMYIDAGVVNCSVSGNTFRNTGSIGIKFQFYDAGANAPRNLSITGNSVDTCGGAGIEVNNTVGTSTVKGVTISGNTVSNTTGIGINVRYASGAAVTGNEVHTSAAEGYYFDNCEDVNISGNQSKNTTKNALLLVNNARMNVNGNSFVNPGQGGVDAGDTSSGIVCSSGSYYSIRNNFVWGDSTKTRYGLFVSGGTQATHSVTNNTIINCEEYGVRFIATTPILEYRDNYFQGLLAPSAGDPLVQTVASAATVNLPLGQKVVQITGTTTITDIGSLGHNGNVVTLLFTDACTVNRTGSVLISSNFAATANDTLTILNDNGVWREISRAVN